VSSSQTLPGFLITAPSSVCVSAVLVSPAVWIQNQKKNLGFIPTNKYPLSVFNKNSTLKRARAETGGADQWVLKRRELPGFARVNKVTSTSLGNPPSVFNKNFTVSNKQPNKQTNKLV